MRSLRERLSAYVWESGMMRWRLGPENLTEGKKRPNHDLDWGTAKEAGNVVLSVMTTSLTAKSRDMEPGRTSCQEIF